MPLQMRCVLPRHGYAVVWLAAAKERGTTMVMTIPAKTTSRHHLAPDTQNSLRSQRTHLLALVSLGKHQHYCCSTGNATRFSGHNHISYFLTLRLQLFHGTFKSRSYFFGVLLALCSASHCFASVVRWHEVFVPQHCLMGCLSSPHKALTRAAGLHLARLTHIYRC
jgi:hypothetical protein